jgi:hypothetical protein
MNYRALEEWPYKWRSIHFPAPGGGPSPPAVGTSGGRALMGRVPSHAACPAFDPDEAPDVIRQIGEADLGGGAGNADGPDHEPEAVLLRGEHGFHRRTHGAGTIGLALGRQVAARLAAEVDS